MADLLRKEFKLALHPTAIIFLALSAMMLIPNYPYYVIFFYTGLAVFFICLSARENNDVVYSMMLPAAKSDIVKARILMAALLEIAQIVIAVPFAVIRQNMDIPGNQVGMDANISLFGLSLIMLGLFNYSFFSAYYKDIKKVGTAFVKASTLVFVYMAVAETCDHAVPFFKNVLDMPDPMYITNKLIVLAAGAAVFVALTLAVCRKAAGSFEGADIQM